MMNFYYQVFNVEDSDEVVYNNENLLVPDSCEIEVKDFESSNKYATNTFDCKKFFDEKLNIFIFPNEDINSRCNNLSISFYFNKEVLANYISFENPVSNRNFKIRSTFKVLETYIDKNYYQLISLYPKRTNEVQYFDLSEVINSYTLYVVQTFQSENYSLFGIDLLDARNECAFQNISFYGNELSNY